MNSDLKNAKEKYKQQEVPDDLDFFVDNAIRKARKKKYFYQKRTFGYSAAAILLLASTFIIGINTSTAFAKSVTKIPLLSSIAHFFTFEKIESETENAKTDVRIPTIKNLHDKQFEKLINEQISKRVNAHVEDAQKRADELMEARKETDPTSPLIEQVEVFGDYLVYFANKRFLSFSVFIYESTAPSYTERYIYNLDLEKNKIVTLKDFFKENIDYITPITKEIKRQIAEIEKDPNKIFFDPNEEGGFQKIKADQPFHLNKNGNIVIYFQKYEIAPGYMGEQEFVIPKSIVNPLSK